MIVKENLCLIFIKMVFVLLNIIRKYGNYWFWMDYWWNVKKIWFVIWFYIWIIIVLVVGSIFKVIFVCINIEFYFVIFFIYLKVFEVFIFFSLYVKVMLIVFYVWVLSIYLLGNYCLVDVVVWIYKEDFNKSVCV